MLCLEVPRKELPNVFHLGTCLGVPYRRAAHGMYIVHKPNVQYICIVVQFVHITCVERFAARFPLTEGNQGISNMLGMSALTSAWEYSYTGTHCVVCSVYITLGCAARAKLFLLGCNTLYTGYDSQKAQQHACMLYAISYSTLNPWSPKVGSI